MSTPLRDLIVIDERAGDEDYVLRLTDAVGDDEHVARTLHDYVVTPDLARAFDRGLGLVADALDANESRAAFLSGSFGSGKSHYMAVLHAVLGAHPSARGITELQPAIAAHDPSLAGKKVLRLAFHMLGAESMEEAVLGGYLRQIQALHPGAPLPAVHQSDQILVDAERQRATLGDERFFAELNGKQNGSGGDVWSGLLGSGTWDGGTYDAARAAAPGTAGRQQLVSALAERFFTAYTSQAGFLGIDAGLNAIATHAAGLDYDAVVLFVDELVLWLAFGVQDREFFRREAQKLTKLVESSTGARAIPLVSFVARQMDLRRWFADSGASGSEQEMLDQAFRHQQSRFLPIELGDDNLAAVAHVRLLHPRDDEAAARIADAFAGLDRRRVVWDVLRDGANTDEQHRGSDEKAFRLTYPFSPALVSTLRSLSGVMQRERTALKVMQRMLVDRRDDITVDDVIPVGDAFDLLVAGGEPLDTQVAALFRSANSLYRDKLRPLILRANGLTEASLRDDPGAAPRSFHTDDRLAKTLLLSAVAPKVPALKEITASRLASLNHGSVVSPLPGNESTIVLAKVQEWSRTVPEIHIGQDRRNPLIRVRLSEVDYESVVQSAIGEDNAGRRRELLRTMVRTALGVADAQPNLTGAIGHDVIWRGSVREVDLVFGNVRDGDWLPDERFHSRPGTWRFVIDHPFDDLGHTSAEDLDRVDRLIAHNVQVQTVVWLPRFLSEDRMRDLSRLVVLDWLLTGNGERWKMHADHLSETDRIQARAILESQRETLHRQLGATVQQAYGAATPAPGNLLADEAHDRVLLSLDRGFNPAAPVGADLAAAFENLVDQAFRSTYPAHPAFEPGHEPVRARELALVATYVERAVADPDGAVLMEPADRATVRRIAGPLRVGTAAETRFLFGDDRFPWGAEFERAMARDGLTPADPVRVSQIREWIRSGTPARGLRDEVADLVVIAWAALRQRGWYSVNGPEPAQRPGSVRPELELRPEPMPTVDAWIRATTRARTLFAGDDSPHLTPSSLATFAGRVHSQAGGYTDSSQRLVTALQEAGTTLGYETGGKRLATAQACAELVSRVDRTAEKVALVRVVAETDLPCSDQAAIASLMRADPIAWALRRFPWDRLAPLREATGTGRPGADAAARVLDDLRTALETDEFDRPLAAELEKAENRAFDWVANHGGGARPADPVAPPDPAPRAAGSTRREPGDGSDAVLDELRAFLEQHPGTAVRVDWRAEP
ncbi:MAG: hypothetical protein L0I76_18495 [Pseudonocardia sp.]|nr:hypothetical protein [Pseudonocardia sp.]